MNKLEIIIAKSKDRGGIYVDFPISRKDLWERLSSVGISKDKWIIRGVKTGSNHFGDIVANSKNLDELNYSGYWMSQFTDDFIFAKCLATASILLPTASILLPT